jgi:subtilase family serine protease
MAHFSPWNRNLPQSLPQAPALLSRNLLANPQSKTARVRIIGMILLALSATILASAQDSTVRLPDHTPPQVATGHAMRTGRYAPNQMVRLAIALKHPKMADEEGFLRDLQDPKSPDFHHFLTAAEWNSRFAPSAADEQAVVEWAKSQGFTITNRYPNRLLVDVEAPSAVIEKALGVTINSYKFEDEVDYSNDRDPAIPAALNGIVIGVLGLNNIQRLHASKPEWDRKGADYVPGPPSAGAGGFTRNATKTKPSQNGGPASNFTNGYADPTNIYSSQAYNYDGLQHLGHCCNPFHVAGGSPPESSIAIAAWGDWSTSDITGFGASYPYLAYNVNGFYIDGQPSGGPNGETLLDTEWTTATANSFGSYLDTAHVWVYMAGSWSQATNSDVFNHMLSDGHARVFTTSWSCTEDTGCSSAAINAWHGIFNSMIGQGWTLMTASGDRGATDDCYFNNPAHTTVAYPASDPDVVGVGGTSLVLNSDGTWNSEPAWQGGAGAGSCANNNGGSGGGQSVHFSRPSYQDYYSAATGRLVPDVSLNSGGIGQNYYFNGTLSPTGGTSIASPEMAGFFAQENAYLLAIGSICGGSYNSPCGPYGQPHSALFDEGLNNRSMHFPFYDITTGCNSNDQTATNNLTYYCAHSSYDLVTGWGPSNMMQLAWSLNWERLSGAANGAPYLTWNGPATNHWYNTSQTVSWTVHDYAGNEGPNGTGVAGFWQAWDTPPADASSEPHGGSGNLFYSGPQYPNAVNGCLSFVNGANGCAGGVTQGCHTAYAVGWNNEGWTTAYGGQSYSYGPICYDYTPPQTTATVDLRPGLPRAPVRTFVVTLNASDQYSGVGTTWVYISGGGVTFPAGWVVYQGPITLKASSAGTIYFESVDKAGNWESLKSVRF